MSDTIPDHEKIVKPPFECPWCEETITDEDGYHHAYEHRDKGPKAVYVEELLWEHNNER